MPKSRLGVALLLPPGVRSEVDGLRRALGDPGRERIPAHLTLVPPVNVRDDSLADALAVLRAAAAATRPFRVTLGPPATFLPVNPVAYLAVGGDLDALHALRDRVFRPPLERSLTWPFVPHVTIANEAAPERIEAALAAMADFEVEVVFERVHLLREEEGRVWRPIADAHFGAPAIVGRGGLPLELTVSERLDAEAQAFEAAQWAVEPTGEERTPLAVTARRPASGDAGSPGRIVGIASGRLTDLSTGNPHTGVLWIPERSGWNAHLSTLIVAADERGTGVGAQLVAAFLSAAAERGAVQATVRTRNDGFYRRLGWTEEARLSDGFVQLRRVLATS